MGSTRTGNQFNYSMCGETMNLMNDECWLLMRMLVFTGKYLLPGTWHHHHYLVPGTWYLVLL